EQPLKLIRGPEFTVRRLLPDPGHQLLETGLAIGRRHLGVQQARQILRELELLLQPRDLATGRNLPVALPVKADENVALRQVGPIEISRRVRRAPCSNITGVSPSAEIAAAAARRSSASSPSVELTNTRRRWSGVLISGVPDDPGFTDCSGPRGSRYTGPPRQFATMPRAGSALLLPTRAPTRHSPAELL